MRPSHVTHLTRTGGAPCMAPAVTASQKKRTFKRVDGHLKHTLATASRNPNHLTPSTPKRCSQICEIVLVCTGVGTHHIARCHAPVSPTVLWVQLNDALSDSGRCLTPNTANPMANKARVVKHAKPSVAVCNQTTIFCVFCRFLGFRR